MFSPLPYGQRQGLAQLTQRNAAIQAQQAAYLQQAGLAAQANKLQQQAALAQQQLGQQGFNNVIPIQSGTGSTWLTANITTASSTNAYITTSTGATTTMGRVMVNRGGGSVWAIYDDDLGVWETTEGDSYNIKIQDGQEKRIALPDGTAIEVKKDGSYTIYDKDAKVTYRANRVRDFNRFINVSDRLEEFIEFCGKQGVKQGEMMELPLNLFVGWLVVQAAKADQEPEPDVKLLPDLRKRTTSRCPGCGRFTLPEMRARKIEFCAPVCFERHYNRQLGKD